MRKTIGVLRDVKRPRKHHIGDVVIGMNPKGLYSGIPGRLIRNAYWQDIKCENGPLAPKSHYAIINAQYTIKFSDGAQRKFNIIKALADFTQEDVEEGD